MQNTVLLAIYVAQKYLVLLNVMKQFESSFKVTVFKGAWQHVYLTKEISYFL